MNLGGYLKLQKKKIKNIFVESLFPSWDLGLFIRWQEHVQIKDIYQVVMADVKVS